MAALFYGLPSDSLSKMALRGAEHPDELLMRASMVDNLAFLAWAQTEKAKSGEGRPVSILERLLGKDKPKNEYKEFSSGAEFDAYWRRNTEV